jgi:hypothetical protein
VSDDKHETEQEAESAADEQSIDDIVEENAEAQPHNSTQRSEPNQMSPAGC